jgi:hypothetical protein
MKNLIQKELETLKEEEETTFTCGDNVVIVKLTKWYYEGKKKTGFLSCKVGKWNNLFDVQVKFAVDHIYAGLVS